MVRQEAAGSGRENVGGNLTTVWEEKGGWGRKVYLSGPATAMLVALRGFNTGAAVVVGAKTQPRRWWGGRDRESIAEWRILVLDCVQEESLVLLSSWQRAEHALCLHGRLYSLKRRGGGGRNTSNGVGGFREGASTGR